MTITCPRPRNRASDNFHTRPDAVAETAAIWFGEDAELTLTAREAKLRYTGSYPPGDVADWHTRLAIVLHCLYLDTRGNDGSHSLPRPIRTEIREDDA